jgi:steroid delta-isomerase-like uncharacterized protein
MMKSVAFLLALAAVSPGAAAKESTRSVQAKTLDAWVAAFNRHDVAAVAALYAPDAAVLRIGPTGWVESKGRDAVRAAVAPYLEAFPDATIAFEKAYSRPGLVIAQWTSAGTNTGPLLGKPPTGERAGIHGISVLWIDADGSIRRDQAAFDEPTLLQQLGLAAGKPRAVADLPSGPTTWVVATGSAQEKKLVETAKRSWPLSWSRHDAKLYDAQITDDYVHSEIGSPNDYAGRKAAAEEIAMYVGAVPDVHAEVQDAWAFGEVVVMTFTFGGTMKGPIGPFPPTGKPFAIHGIDVDEFRGVKMTRATSYSNFTEFLAQVAPK